MFFKPKHPGVFLGQITLIVFDNFLNLKNALKQNINMLQYYNDETMTE
jgi:hypothetical protein